MNVGFFPNLSKGTIIPVMQETLALCKKYNLDVFIPNDTENKALDTVLGISADHYLPRPEIFKHLDLAFSFGGDGTILELTRQIIPLQIPICGINLGELGFLNQIELEQLEEKINEISQGNYELEERSYFLGKIIRENGSIQELAPIMNDLVVTHPLPGKMARIILAINNGETQTYPCDGIIVSTSSGSTGYNLSAGGPIMAPDNHSMIITPIAPHLLQSVSLILKECSHIDITMPQREKELHIAIDGTFDYTFTNKDRLEIQSGREHFEFIRFYDKPFFATLFKKLTARSIDN